MSKFWYVLLHGCAAACQITHLESAVNAMKYPAGFWLCLPCTLAPAFHVYVYQDCNERHACSESTEPVYHPTRNTLAVTERAAGLQGKGNLSPYSYFNVMSHDPPYVAIGCCRTRGRPNQMKDSEQNILETGCGL